MFNNLWIIKLIKGVFLNIVAFPDINLPYLLKNTVNMTEM